MDYNLKQIHGECGWHEKAILNSKLCGCFYCEKIFSATEISEWIEESKDCPRGAGRTALCPHCDIDTVLPESNLYEITPELLAAMNKEWCT
jgi:hypothetical protein